jgi:hypothetical protein
VFVSGQPCESNDANGQLLWGECRKGTWQDVGHGTLQCVVNGPQPEICDGLDNNCNGAIDDAAPACSTSGTL